MLRRTANPGVSFSRGIKDPQKFSSKESSSSNNLAVAGDGDGRKGISGLCCFLVRVPKNCPRQFSPMRCLQILGAKMARAIRLVSVKRIRNGRKRSSSKVSSSNSTRSSRLSIAQLDSHQAEALEDCIEYINSTTSFQRSNSVSAL